MTEGRRRRGSRWPAVVGTALLVLVLVGILGTMLIAVIPRIGGGPGSRRAGPVDELRVIVTFMIDRRTGRTSGAWPAYSGRNFVLAVVATHDLDARRRENLELLFPVSGLPDALGPEDYAAVTRDALRTRRFPHLTEMAGRRNTDPRYRITEAQEREGTPLVAVPYRDGLFLGYSNGDVRFHERDEFDLPDDGPIPFGDAARHPTLRMLSNE